MDEQPTRANFVVLVVEDEYLIAMELVMLVERAGYDVLGPATTVATALRFIEHQRPDACILDVNLRGETSTSVASELRDRRVPFLLSSAYDRATLDQHSVFSGVHNLGKPTSPDELISALAVMLNE